MPLLERAKPQGVGGKPTNVSTFTKKYYGGMIEFKENNYVKTSEQRKKSRTCKLPEKVRNRMGYAKR